MKQACQALREKFNLTENAINEKYRVACSQDKLDDIPLTRIFPPEENELSFDWLKRIRLEFGKLFQSFQTKPNERTKEKAFKMILLYKLAYNIKEEIEKAEQQGPKTEEDEEFFKAQKACREEAHIEIEEARRKEEKEALKKSSRSS